MCSDSDLPHDDIDVVAVALVCVDDDDEFNARAWIECHCCYASQPVSARTLKWTLRLRTDVGMTA